MQYTPYEPKVGNPFMSQATRLNSLLFLLQDGSWDTPGKKDAFAQQVFSVIEQYAPGFRDSVLGYDMLTVRGWTRRIVCFDADVRVRSVVSRLIWSASSRCPRATSSMAPWGWTR